MKHLLIPLLIFFAACSSAPEKMKWKSFSTGEALSNWRISFDYPSNWATSEMISCIEDEDPALPGSQCSRPTFYAEFAENERCIKNYIPECKGRHFMLVISPNEKNLPLYPWSKAANADVLVPYARDRRALKSDLGLKFQTPDGMAEVVLTGSGEIFEGMLKTIGVSISP